MTSFTVIVPWDNPLPEEWTPILVWHLMGHAHELAQNGNPAGMFLTFRFDEVDCTDEAAMLRVVQENMELVKRCWTHRVRFL